MNLHKRKLLTCCIIIFILLYIFWMLYGSLVKENMTYIDIITLCVIIENIHYYVNWKKSLRFRFGCIL